MALPVLPEFKLQGLKAQPGQLAAGAFYRKLIDAGFSPAQVAAAPSAAEAAQRAHAAGAAAAPECNAEAPPQQRGADPHAAADPPSGKAAGNRAPGNDAHAARGAEPDAAAASTAGLGSDSQLQVLRPVIRAKASSRAAADADSSAFVGPALNYGIPASNVGFKMLQKQGWQVGAGLGADSQGRREPLAQSQQKGRRGLGAGAAAAAAAAKQQQQAQQQQPRQQEQEKAKQVKAARIPLPGDSESFDAKVKRHRQVLQTEADEAAGKAIQRYMYMAFNDTTSEVTGDTNPLLRRNRNRLSATNPLL